MKRQTPRGDENLICPLHKQAMSEVCHKCPWWTQVRGKNPQSEEEIDRWDCAIAWMPLLTIENSQMQRQTGAAVESFRNEMVKANDTNIAITKAVASMAVNGQGLGAPAPKQITQGQR